VIKLATLKKTFCSEYTALCTGLTLQLEIICALIYSAVNYLILRKCSVVSIVNLLAVAGSWR